MKEHTVNCCALDEDRADCLGLRISQGHVVVGFNGFVSMAVSCLQAAWYTVNDTDWFEEAWGKIKEYAIKEKARYEESRSIVRSPFGAAVSSAAVDEDDFAIVDRLLNIDARHQQSGGHQSGQCGAGEKGYWLGDGDSCLVFS